jgi:hypothetical protein
MKSVSNTKCFVRDAQQGSEYQVGLLCQVLCRSDYQTPEYQNHLKTEQAGVQILDQVLVRNSNSPFAWNRTFKF